MEEHRRKVREFLARPPFRLRNISDDDLNIFCTALTHDSHSNETGRESYERLEFLGDAVIELIVCEHIFRTTQGTEGNMTSMKQDIVANRKISAKMFEKGIEIDKVMLLGHGHMDRTTKANIPEDNMRADAFEALIGALYIIYGMENARRVVEESLL